ncbi:MAG TPA: metallophosphoesterase [Steroidobacteraceae bacterium]|nr:metallophosphoesterase [Steroidobacteraceae bacterium]
MRTSANTRAHVRGMAATAAVSLAVLSMGLSRAASAADPVIFSFATVGDSRQDPAAPDPTTLLPNNTGTLLPQDALWLQNSKAATRILRTIQSEKPNLLFFNGDMIYGYGRAAIPSSWSTTPPATIAAVTGSDLVQHYTQYAYWRGMIANLFEMGTYVVPVPGNHETQCSESVAGNGLLSSSNPNGCASGKHAYVENEQAFVANMGDLITDLAANQRFTTVSGVTASNVTGLTQATAPQQSTNNGAITTNQAELTYSFDIATSLGNLHFAVVNTDPSGADGTAPADWLAQDFAAARSKGAVKFFVFGHKPAFTYNYAAASGGTVAAGGLDATSPISLRNAFWSVIAQYGATYFCGHEHTVNIAQYADPTGVSQATPYQVIVGSGGSPFDDKLVGACPACTEPLLTAPTDRYYAWALVQVHQSGAVTLTAYGFNDAFGPTQQISTIASLE